MLCGVTKLIITKADVLDTFDPIKMAVAYEVNGKHTDELPYDLTDEMTLKPVYQTFEQWGSSIEKCTNFDELPATFKEFCTFIEQYLGTKIAFVSNGIRRDQLIFIP